MSTGNLFLDLILLSIPVAAIGLWWTGMRVKELAIEHVRRSCDREGVQLLDYTVVLRRLRPVRSSQGPMCLRREFSFDFTVHGAHRDQGSVTMLGQSLSRVRFPYTRDDEGNRVFLH